jgi:hypothetical protein
MTMALLRGKVRTRVSLLACPTAGCVAVRVPDPTKHAGSQENASQQASGYSFVWLEIGSIGSVPYMKYFV